MVYFFFIVPIFYFRAHNTNDDDGLDGLELLKAITHAHAHEKHEAQHAEVRITKENFLEKTKMRPRSNKKKQKKTR